MDRIRLILEWTVLLPVWRRFIPFRWGQISAAVGTGLLWIVIISIAAGSGDGDDESDGIVGGATATPTATPSPTPGATPAATPTRTPEPTSTIAPTATPTASPTPTPVPTPAPTPIVLQGVGQVVTDPITPPSAISTITFTHAGPSNFIVKVFQNGEEDLLVNEIGRYQGTRAIVGAEPFFLEINADGSGTATIKPIGIVPSSSFGGSGDAISGLFIPSSTNAAPWEVSHDGSRNFIVWLFCFGGFDLVQNEIGAVTGSTVVSFAEGPCYWDVRADGNWSLNPR